MMSTPRGPEILPSSRGLLDTSVVVDLALLDPALLPAEGAVSTITLAELAAGPHATSDPQERALRQAVLQSVEATVAALPFDSAAARAFGRLYAAVVSGGRKPRGRRSVDLLIAASALANGLPLYTRNPADFAGLEHLIHIVSV